MSTENLPLSYAIRGAQSEDSNEILDLDLKCFESPWEAEYWATLGRSSEYAISVATYFGAVVGFAVAQEPDAGRGVNLLKLAVKPSHRQKNVSMFLLAAIVMYAQNKGANHLYMVVPENTIYPGPRNTSEWLKIVGFTATKPFLKKHFTAYGDYEDGVKFIAPITPMPNRNRL